jgi:ABC-type Fe3+ transport system substrate-binding protein
MLCARAFGQARRRGGGAPPKESPRHGRGLPVNSFYSVSTAAVAANSEVGEAARAVIRFLTTPAAAAVFKAKGLEPG